MNEHLSRSKILSSLFWKLMERGGSQGINFIVTIILARILSPGEYGLIAIVSVFISFANVFVQGGLNTALIQKKDAEEIDYSTIFYITLLIALLLYIILYFSAPTIANFYSNTQLTPVIRILSLTLFFGAINSLQVAIVSKQMQFKKLFYSSVGAIFISGIIGIGMAYFNYGIWSLVGQQLTFQIATTFIMFFTVQWRPKLLFSYHRFKELFDYGWKILLSNLLTTFFLNIRSLIIGKMYSPQMLAFFDKGKQFPSIIMTNINSSIQSVLFPAYSAEQDNRIRVRNMVRRSIKTSSFIIFPLMIGLAVTAKPIVIVLLTEKWLPAVPFIQIFCATYMLMPIHSANMEAIKALGYSNYILKNEIAKKTIEFVILVISLFFGIYAIAFGALISNIISLAINSYPNIKLLQYNYIEQLKDVLPSLIISIIMGIFVYLLKYINMSTVAILSLQIILGVNIYMGLSYLFKVESLSYIINIIKSKK